MGEVNFKQIKAGRLEEVFQAEGVRTKPEDAPSSRISYWLSMAAARTARAGKVRGIEKVQIVDGEPAYQ